MLGFFRPFLGTRRRLVITTAAVLSVGFLAFAVEHRHVGTAPLADVMPDALPNYDGCQPCTPLAARIAWSIDHEPGAWSSDGFYLTRRTGPVVWIAGGVPDLKVGPERRTAKTGWEPAPADRLLIYRASQRWTAWRVEQQLRPHRGGLATLFRRP